MGQDIILPPHNRLKLQYRKLLKEFKKKQRLNKQACLECGRTKLKSLLQYTCLLQEWFKHMFQPKISDKP